MSVLTQATADGLVMAKRNLIKVKRIPDLLIFTTVQPIMFVLLFAYVFGGAIPMTFRKESSTGSDHCPWRGRQCCSAGRSRIWSTTASSWS